jgi:hypothetical protein
MLGFAARNTVYPEFVLGRRAKEEQPQAAPIDDEAAQRDPAQLPKGHATPKRRDSQTQRKMAAKVPSDPKAAKKALREREREARMTARAGLMAGDERYLPPRDQGPAKGFTRDYVDRRRRASEYFVFVAVAILVASFIRNPQMQGFISMLWFVIVAVIIIEVGWMVFSLNGTLKQKWPAKEDRKGCLFYAVLRCLQIRRLRIPPPRIRPGGAPVTPKS